MCLPLHFWTRLVISVIIFFMEFSRVSTLGNVNDLSYFSRQMCMYLHPSLCEQESQRKGQYQYIYWKTWVLIHHFLFVLCNVLQYQGLNDTKHIYGQRGKKSMYYTNILKRTKSAKVMKGRASGYTKKSLGNKDKYKKSMWCKNSWRDSMAWGAYQWPQRHWSDVVRAAGWGDRPGLGCGVGVNLWSGEDGWTYCCVIICIHLYSVWQLSPNTKFRIPQISLKVIVISMYSTWKFLKSFNYSIISTHKSYRFYVCKGTYNDANGKFACK